MRPARRRKCRRPEVLQFAMKITDKPGADRQARDRLKAAIRAEDA